MVSPLVSGCIITFEAFLEVESEFEFVSDVPLAFDAPILYKVSSDRSTKREDASWRWWEGAISMEFKKLSDRLMGCEIPLTPGRFLEFSWDEIKIDGRTFAPVVTPGSDDKARSGEICADTVASGSPMRTITATNDAERKTEYLNTILI